MGKKELKAGGSGSVTLGSITPRQKPKGNKQSHVNAKLMLKLEHIKNLAVWASGEASIPSLGAFFGNRLAASSEALGLPPEPSLFSCQNCESVLQPGYNCLLFELRRMMQRHDARITRNPETAPQKLCCLLLPVLFASKSKERKLLRGYFEADMPTKGQNHLQK
nr:uncharacterized protein LOC109166698 [Ipomoea batatas]